MQGGSTYSTVNRVVIHFLIWAVFGLYFYRQLFFTSVPIPGQYWINQTITLGLLIAAFYLNSAILSPRLLFRGYVLRYIAIVIGIVASIVLLNNWVDHIFPVYEYPGAGLDKRRLTPGHWWPNSPPRLKNLFSFRISDLFTLIISGLVIGISTTLAAIQKWQRDGHERRELEKNNITTELSLLKAQINPHFFFNTLNNIYVLTETDPKIAGQAIHRLSKMMRYLLYDTQKRDTTLSEEIAFIRNYIGLMQLRLTNMVQVSINIPTDLKDMQIAPMLFLPFVENAFKHGVSTIQKSYINVSITQIESVIQLIVNNSIIHEHAVPLETERGIGLVNTHRRLELLYPGKYKLNLGEERSRKEYTVHLILDLS